MAISESSLPSEATVRIVPRVLTLPFRVLLTWGQLALSSHRLRPHLATGLTLTGSAQRIHRITTATR